MLCMLTNLLNTFITYLHVSYYYFLDCNTVDDTASLLARELLATHLALNIPIVRTIFSNDIFPIADTEEPRRQLDINEFPILYELIAHHYNFLPSVCPESVFESCNTDDDLFLSISEMISCV